MTPTDQPPTAATQHGFDAATADLLESGGFARTAVTGVRTVATGVMEVTLDRQGAFPPGAHLELAIAAEQDPTADPMIRHYSLCSDPAGDEPWRIAVLNEPLGRGGSTWLHENLGPGSQLMVRGPRSTFPFHDDRPALFIAGGIGITPLHAMVRSAARAGLDWHLIYVGRTAELMAFATDLQDSHGPRVDVRITETGGRPDVVGLAAAWLDERTPTAPEAPAPVVYTCGPQPLMDAVARGLADRPGVTVEFEEFVSDPQPPAAAGTAPAEAGAPGFPAGGDEPAGTSAIAAGTDSAHDPSNEPFVVELADGTEVEVGSTETILTALGRAGIRTLSSCQKGTCGTCETTILEGEAIHRDEVLSDEEHEAQETMMICVSRCRGARICLDL